MTPQEQAEQEARELIICDCRGRTDGHWSWCSISRFCPAIAARLEALYEEIEHWREHYDLLAAEGIEQQAQLAAAQAEAKANVIKGLEMAREAVDDVRLEFKLRWRIADSAQKAIEAIDALIDAERGKERA